MTAAPRLLLRSTATGATVGFALALGEGLRLLGEGAVGREDLVGLVATGTTLLLPPGLVLGIGVGLLTIGLGLELELGSLLPRLARGLRRTTAPGWIGAGAAALGALVTAFAAFDLVLGPRLGHPNPQDAGLAVTLGGSLVPGVALLTGTLAAAWSRRLFGRHADSPALRWAVLLLLLLAAGGAAWLVAARFRGTLEAVELRPPLALLGGGGLWLLVETLFARLPVAARRGLAWTAPAALGALCSFGLYALDDLPTARAAVVRDRGLTGLLAGRAQRLLDHDGDGFSRLLGGGDCREDDPAIFPGADDVPGNGVDEDCDGTDLILPPPAVEPPPPPRLPLHSRADLLAPRHNIILLSIAPLRPDHLGCYGYHRDTSPNIDELARSAIRFANPYSLSNKTPSVIGSLITGKYPSEHQRTFQHFNKFLPDNITLAERLKYAGFKTSGVGSHWYFLPSFGISQGIDRWEVIYEPGDRMEAVPTAAKIADRAIAHLQELRRSPEPYFLWVHFIDPHKLYIAHDEVPSFGTRAVDLYDGEIRYTDLHLGRLLAEIDGGEDRPRTAVALIADHGECFGEHGEYFHGWSVHEPQIRVPFLLRVPGLEPRVVQTRVSLVDLVPTLLDLAGVSPKLTEEQDTDPEHPLRGVSLLPDLLAGGEWTSRPIYAEVYPGPSNSAFSAFLVDDLKLIHIWGGNVYSLFDLAADPGELRDLTRERPDLAASMRQRYQVWRRQNVRPVEPLRPPEPPK